MSRTRAGLCLVLSAACAGCASPSSPSPKARSQSALQPLSVVFNKVDDGFMKLLNGTSPIEAWKPWGAPPDAPILRPDLLAEFKADEVVRFDGYGMDFDLCFLNERKKDGSIVGWINGFVFFDRDEPGLGIISFDEKGTYRSGLEEIETYARLQPELAEAATAFLEAIRSRNQAALIVGDFDNLQKRLPQDVDRQSGDEFAKQLRVSVEAVFERIAKLEYTEVRLRLDRCFSFAVDKNGVSKGIVCLCIEIDRQSRQAGVVPYAYQSFTKREK